MLRNKQTLINTFSSAGESLVIPLLMLVLTPLFLMHLGPENFAIWVLINTIIASLSALSFGGENAMIKYISDESYVKKNVFSSIFIFQIGAISIVSVLSYIIFYLYLDIYLNDNSNDNLQNFSFYILVLFIFKQFELLIHSFLKGKERYELYALFSTTSKFFFYGVQLLSLLATKEVQIIFENSAIYSVIAFVLQGLLVKHLYTDLEFFYGANKKTIISVFNYSLWSWFNGIVGVFTVHFDKWAVGYFYGLKTLGYYSIAVLVFNQIYMVMSSLIAWYFPRVSRYGFVDSTKILYNNLVLILLILSIGISVFFLNYDQFFIIWLGQTSYQNTSVFISLFLAILPILSLKIVPHYLLLATGKIKKKFSFDLIGLFLKMVIVLLTLSILGVNEMISFLMIEFLIIAYLYHLNFYKSLTNLTRFACIVSIAYSFLASVYIQ